MDDGVLKILGQISNTNAYFNTSLRFSTTYFSTRGLCPPGPSLKPPMLIIYTNYQLRIYVDCKMQSLCYAYSMKCSSQYYA